MTSTELLAAMIVLVVIGMVFGRPFVNGLVTLKHDIFSRSRFVPYDLTRPNSGYPIHMAGARESFQAGLYARPAFGADGIPVTDYHWTRQIGIPAGRYKNPGRIALYALEGCFVPWLDSGSPALLDDFRCQLNWLRDHQGPTGEYTYDFEHRRFGKQAGWISAWAQGLAVSALIRGYLLFGEPALLASAKRAADPMLRRVQEGGVLWVDEDGWWLEEVPEDPPSHILNGFVTAWYGLVDLEAVSSDPTISAVRSACAETLRRHAPRFGEDGVLQYDLKRRARATLGYPRLQIEQMRSLAFLTGVPEFAYLADDWERRFDRRPPATMLRRWLKAAWWALNYRQAQVRGAIHRRAQSDKGPGMSA